MCDLDFTCKSFPDVRSLLSIIFIILPDVNLADVSDMTLPCINEGDLTSTMTSIFSATSIDIDYLARSV